jgi:DNA-binding beta-propeller fold protein YncE
MADYDPFLRPKGSVRLPTDGVPARAADDEAGDLFVTLIQDDHVVRLEEATHKVDLPPIKVGHKPFGIGYDSDTNSMWVANIGSRTLTQIDAKTGRVLTTVDAKGPLQGSIAARLGVVYAAGSNDVVRVDVVR